MTDQVQTENSKPTAAPKPDASDKVQVAKSASTRTRKTSTRETPKSSRPAKAEASNAEVQATDRPEDSVVVFRSKVPEPLAITLAGVRSIRNPQFPGHYEWHIPLDQLANAEGHYHVRRGRIQRVEN